jgi:hypothetical protein
MIFVIAQEISMKCLQKQFAALGFSIFSIAAAPLAVQAQDGVNLKMFAPESGARVGIGGFGWFVDLQLEFDTPLENTGFTGFQLTGPGVHANAAPMPGGFSPGKDDRLPGLIVLLSTTTTNAAFAGSCQNLANLFNLTGVTNRKADSTELWGTWIVGAPNFGVNTESKIFVAVAADKNNDHIFNDAPNVVPDADGNGICDEKDLKAFGVASNIRRTSFFINP